MRKLPILPAVGPGVDPYNSAMDRTIGNTTPPDRAPFDGMIPASNRSEAESAYVTPSEVRPNERRKKSAIRRARPVLISDRDMKNAPNPSQTVGSA